MRHHEDAEQRVVFQWAAYHPALRWMHAIPNGGRRNKAEAARLRGQGVKPGVADICLPLARKGYHGLYIEMKRRRADGSSTVSKDQRDFGEHANSEGYLWAVCYGAGEAIDLIREYAGL